MHYLRYDEIVKNKPYNKYKICKIDSVTLYNNNNLKNLYDIHDLLMKNTKTIDFKKFKGTVYQNYFEGIEFKSSENDKIYLPIDYFYKFYKFIQEMNSELINISLDISEQREYEKNVLNFCNIKINVLNCPDNIYALLVIYNNLED